MKKLIAVLAVMFTIDAAAFVGTGNERIDEAREFMRYQNGGTNLKNHRIAYWQGAIAGLSSVFGESSYKHNVCYPKEANLAQLAEIAARYLIDYPEKRAKSLNVLVWESHRIAFGRQDENCWSNNEE